MTVLRGTANCAGRRSIDVDGRTDVAGRDAWATLREVTFDPRHLVSNRVVSAQRSDDASVAVDLLRTRVRRALRERAWTRIGITSPTKGCGKTFLAANLALSMARVPSSRTLLIDMDLRIPSLAALFGVQETPPIEHLFRRRESLLRHVVRANDGLAMLLNRCPVPEAAELLQDPGTGAALETVQAALAPELVLYDLPPMLACDDVMAFLPNLDCVLLVACAGRTKAEDIRKCERLLGEQSPILGIVFNKAQEPVEEPYGYGYGAAR